MDHPGLAPTHPPRISAHEQLGRSAKPAHTLRVTAAFVMTLLAGYGQVLAIFGATLQAYYGLTLRQLGLTLSVGMIPAGIAAILAGAATAGWGPRAVLRWCLVGVAIGAALVAAGQRWGVMLMGAALLNGFYNAVYVVSQPYLTSLFPTQQRRVLALYLATIAAAGVLFPLLAQWLLSVHARNPEVAFGWFLYPPFALIAVLTLFGAALFRRRPGETPTAPTHVSARTLHGGGRSALLLAVLILIGSADNAVSVWLPRVLQSSSFETFSRLMKPGYVMAAFCLTYMIARTGLSLLREQTGRRLFLALPALLGGCVFLAGVMLHTGAGIAAGVILGSFIWSLQVPATLGMLSVREGPRFGWAVALFGVGASIGGFAVTQAMSSIGDRLGDLQLWRILLIPGAIYVTAGVTAAACVCGRRA